MDINLLLLALLFLLVYFWSKEILGRWWAFFPSLLTVLAPGVVVENQLAVLAMVVALITFLNFLFHPSRFNLLVAGLAFGVAQLPNAGAAMLFFYDVVVLVLFYLIGVVRDWELTVAKERWRRFQVRGFRYLRSLVIIFLIGLAVFYLTHIGINLFLNEQVGFGVSFNAANEALVNYHQIIKELRVVSSPLPALASQPWPVIILMIAAVVLAIGHFFQSLKKFQLIRYLVEYFPQLSLVIFIVFIFYSSQPTAAMLPFLFILAAQPVRRFIITNSNKEIIIVLAHEALSFSAKWLVLLAFILWYAIDAASIYLE